MVRPTPQLGPHRQPRMEIRFIAVQSVTIPVPAQPIPIQSYLRQPQRLVQALGASTQIEPLGPELYRFTVRPLRFMQFNIQPSVDLRVWTGDDGVLRIQSTACEVRGIEFINSRFRLALTGELAAVTGKTGPLLEGNVDLGVEVDVPSPLSMMPKAMLQSAGNGLLMSVLVTVKQRLLESVMIDYRQWVYDQQSVNSSGLPVESRLS
jgi:Protein of unknown function (DUF1997)